MLAKEGFKPKRTIYILFGQDEEIGGGQGLSAPVVFWEILIPFSFPVWNDVTWHFGFVDNFIFHNQKQ